MHRAPIVCAALPAILYSQWTSPLVPRTLSSAKDQRTLYVARLRSPEYAGCREFLPAQESECTSKCFLLPPHECTVPSNRPPQPDADVRYAEPNTPPVRRPPPEAGNRSTIQSLRPRFARRPAERWLREP